MMNSLDSDVPQNSSAFDLSNNPPPYHTQPPVNQKKRSRDAVALVRSSLITTAHAASISAPPINTLPIELLSRIFHITRDMERIEWRPRWSNGTHPLRPILTLSHVNTLWRRIVTSDPHLWTHVVLNDQNRTIHSQPGLCQLLDLQVRYTEGIPLDIDIDAKHLCFEEYEARIFRLQHRWRTASICLSRQSQKWLPTLLKLPLLTSLNLTLPWVGNDRTIVIHKSSLPCLREVTLSLVGYVPDQSAIIELPWAQIKNLTLENFTLCRLCTTAQSASISLERLEIKSLRPYYADADLALESIKTARLPQLSQLCMTGLDIPVSFHPLLFLSAPAVESLRFLRFDSSDVVALGHFIRASDNPPINNVMFTFHRDDRPNGQRIVQQFAHLETLHIHYQIEKRMGSSQQPLVYAATLLEMLKNSRRLKSLELYLAEIPWQLLVELMDGQPDLRRLVLTGRLLVGRKDEIIQVMGQIGKWKTAGLDVQSLYQLEIRNRTYNL